MYGAGYWNDARGFSRTTAYATNGGYDRTIFHSSSVQEEVRSLAWGAYIADSTYRRESPGFDIVSVVIENGVGEVTRVAAIDDVFNRFGKRK